MKVNSIECICVSTTVSFTHVKLINLQLHCLLLLATMSVMLFVLTRHFGLNVTKITLDFPPVMISADNRNFMGNNYVDRALIRTQFNKLPDKSLRSLYGLWTMVGVNHLNFANRAIQRINDNQTWIEGDIVECGVWKGGMTMAMVLENMKTNIDRHFWLFDTFEGMPEPSDNKDDPRAKQIFKDMVEGRKTDPFVEDDKWCYGPLDVVRNNIAYTGYPEENFHFIKGKVEDTLPVTNLPEKIAILRLDTDWYQSTKMELEYMYERIQPGGALIVDDYCAWKGSKEAVYEYFKEKLNLDVNVVATEQPCLNYWKTK